MVVASVSPNLDGELMTPTVPRETEDAFHALDTAHGGTVEKATLAAALG